MMNSAKWIKYTVLGLMTMALNACAGVPSPEPSTLPIPTPSTISSTTPSQPAAALGQIAYGISFGFCRGGHCDHHLSITAERMRLVHQSLQDAEKYPEKVIEKPTPAETWQTLNRLASFKTLQALPERIGCPDCADGGAEWIELQQDALSQRVTFEPQAGLPPQAELLAELRKLYEELTADEPAAG